MQSGNPYSITLNNDQSNTGVQVTQRPNRIGNGSEDGGRWFDTGAYVLNPLNTYLRRRKTINWTFR